MLDKLNKNILATIIYYDGLDYPLTVFEIWKNLIKMDYCNQHGDAEDISLLEIIKRLEAKEMFVDIEQLNGFYFLKGRKKIVEKRIANGKIAARKLKGIRRVVRIFRSIPFVKMIGVTGGVAMKNSSAKSDWDLLIVFQHGKIWTGRTMVTILSQLIGKRRYGKKIMDRVCLNFFVTDQSLEIIMKDLFSASEYMFLFPLFGRETYLRFQIKNHWIKNMKPNFALDETGPLKMVEDSAFSKNCRILGEKLLAPKWIEKMLKKIEKNRIMKNPKTHQEGSMVYASDDALIFLPSPHGPKIFESFKEKLNKLDQQKNA